VKVSDAYTISPLGENAVTISVGTSINLETNKKVFKLYNQLLKSRRIAWLDIIPAYTTVTIVYDVLAIRQQQTSAYKWIENEIEKIIAEPEAQEVFVSRQIQIPVCYDVSFALDGERIAAERNISFDELIELHSSKIYQVFMIGFLPGFAYMGSVDQRIAAPRMATPRTLVPAGSVGIAGEQTGIYPLDSPGGWNIIGKTPLKIFDSNAQEPVLLHPGDHVSFVPISKEEFEEFSPSNFKLILDES
jgi:inhibitor of KinA